MPPKAALSEERVEDSSDENSSDSNEGVALKPTANGHSQLSISKSHTLSDDEQNDSESDISTSNSDSGSSTGSKRRATSPPKQISEPLPKRKKTNVSEKVKRIEASQYAPPRGYAPVSLETVGVVNSTAIFSNMEGKQVWHISAPATVLVSQISSIDLQAVLRGGTILEQKGTKYTMKPSDSDKGTILVPDNVDAAYLPTSLKVTRSFHIEEKAKAMDKSTEQNNGTSESNLKDIHSAESTNHTFFATHLGDPKTPRKQPENLKARYVPFGVLTDRPGITAHQERPKGAEITINNSHQNPTQNSHDAASMMSGLEHDSGHEETRPRSDTRHLPQSSMQASTSRKTPERAKKGIDGASIEGSQPQTPSSITEPDKEKKKRKKHKRDRDDEMETVFETPVSSVKTALQSPPSANVSSTPVSSGKQKKRTAR